MFVEDKTANSILFVSENLYGLKLSCFLLFGSYAVFGEETSMNYFQKIEYLVEYFTKNLSKQRQF